MLIDQSEEFAYTVCYSVEVYAATGYCFGLRGCIPWRNSRTDKAGIIFPVPLEELDSSDRGDDVQRRFRYQHGYGVLLLIAASAGNLTFKAIWCEQHDDLLAEREDGKFESYQVKTSTPQDGRITLQNTGLTSAMLKWVNLEQKFSDKIDAYHFVSNSQFENRESKRSASPVELIRAIKSASDLSGLDTTHTNMLDTVASHIKCDHSTLFSVLRKSELVKGPALESFASEISHDHLAKLPACTNLSAADLDALRDELMQKVWQASSLDVPDQSKHWTSIFETGSKDPTLSSKRIDVSDIEMVVGQYKQIPLRFGPSSLTLSHATKGKKVDTFDEKLLKGDLAPYLETMRLRKLCAENHLMELASKAPEKIEDIENQIACVVKGVCDDAHLLASKQGQPFGREMLRIVQSSVKDTIREKAETVHHLPFEVLLGVAGLLTEECKVWWSEPFDLVGKV